MQVAYKQLLFTNYYELYTQLQILSSVLFSARRFLNTGAHRGSYGPHAALQVQ